MYNLVMTSMGAFEARAALPELLNRVEGGEDLEVTHHAHTALTDDHREAALAFMTSANRFQGR